MLTRTSATGQGMRCPSAVVVPGRGERWWPAAGMLWSPQWGRMSRDLVAARTLGRYRPSAFVGVAK